MNAKSLRALAAVVLAGQVMLACASEGSHAGDEQSVLAGSGGSGAGAGAGAGGNAGAAGGDSGAGGVAGGMPTGGCARGEMVVTARALPDAAGPYSFALYDFAADALLLQSVDQLFELASGQSEPRVLYDRFVGDWLQIDGDRILAPNEFLLDDDATEEVLAALPRSGGNASAVVSVPAEPLGTGFGFSDRQIVGDSVYWLYETHSDDGDSYRVLAAMWDPPGEPTELLESQHDLRDLIVADGHAFVTQAQNEDFNSPTDQRVIDLSSGQVLEQTGEAMYGAEVREAIGDWLMIVPELDAIEDPSQFGLYAVRADGSGQHFLHQNFNLTVSPVVEGEAAVSIWELDDDTYRIFRFTTDGMLVPVACVPAGEDDVIALALSESYVYLTLADNDSMTWVERVPL